mmetsp:Transcript_15281/g.33199  ORF Transcript_15281/g.33199 Transcript_15281/m.33199 type:complete len:175 (+) Transcript_15281:136-660(+)
MVRSAPSAQRLDSAGSRVSRTSSGGSRQTPSDFTMVRTSSGQVLYIPKTPKTPVTVRRTTSGEVGYIGMTIDGNNRVTKLQDDSPALEVGVRLGDVVLAVNGHRLTPGVAPGRLLRGPPGHRVQLIVGRKTERLQFGVTRASKPTAHAPARPDQRMPDPAPTQPDATADATPPQ